MAYIILVVDYLIKWMKVKVVHIANKKTTTIPLFWNIIAQYGPRVLISDRGTHFQNNLIKELTATYDIDHQKITPYHHQTNGLAERVNQTIVQILQKTLEGSKCDWDSKLKAALWTYRTTLKMITKQTSFALVYDIEVILPIELEILSLLSAIEAQMPISKSIQNHRLMIEGLNESWGLNA